MNDNFTKLAFTDSVKKLQERYGSRHSYQRMEDAGDRFVLTDKEKGFIASRDSFYMATVGSNGWPYVQFRGGPIGFLKALDDTTLAFADFRGNRQYISSGNVLDTTKVAMILLDYPSQKRLKIWADAEIIFAQDDEAMAAATRVEGYKAVVERVFKLNVRAYDWNCPQHITPRYRLDEIALEIQKLNPDFIKSCRPNSAE